ncbi:MAG: carboxylesterase/lipase family protein, partial [Pseudomonadales bacterium]|nr:carboxylesterase/lipase family protein [Pseudomonadales bacterium]
MTRKSKLHISRRALLHGAAAGTAMLTLPRLAWAFATDVSPEIMTTEGPVRGLSDAGVFSFKGIPYAAPPVGKLRFQAPQPAVPRNTLLEAMRYGHSAMQMNSGSSAVRYPGKIGPALSQVFGSQNDLMIEDEDCLTLNIWSPGFSGEKKPVMVWFHGGGFNYGSGSWPAYDGHNLAANHDVVVVTVNHRLNAYGFLNLADIGGEQFRDSGVAGQLDLVQSLKWVQSNISAFGGDPDNVTIFGQSGGGVKVSLLHGMPAARGLFHKCIIQSGAGLEAGEPNDATEIAEKVLHALG